MPPPQLPAPYACAAATLVNQCKLTCDRRGGAGPWLWRSPQLACSRWPWRPATEPPSGPLRQGAAGTVIEVNHTKGGSRPTIEYAVTGQKYQAHTAWPYPQTTFAVGQSVTVRYPSARPSLGMPDSFAELWPLPLLLLTIGLLLLGLAWKARTGLDRCPRLLRLRACILGAVLGLTLFSVLCIPGGYEIFAGKWGLVSLLGGMLLSPAGSCRRPGSRWILALVRSCPLPAL